MSAFSISRPSMELIMKDIIRASVDTVGDIVSSLDNQLRWFLPLEHPLTFTVISYLLSLRKIRYARSPNYQYILNSEGFFGLNTLWSWKCQSSFRTESSPYLRNISSPWLIPSCDSMVSLVIMMGARVGSLIEFI